MYNQKSKDVAADESTNGSTLDYGEASLPAVEEARASVHLKGNERSNYTKVTTKLLYGGIALFFLVLVVVLPVTIVTVRKNNSSSSSSSASAVRQSSVDAVTAYMVAQKVSDPSTFQDTQSAQYKAAQWLAETDGANLPVPTTSIAADSKAYRYMFRYVMALNYYALGGPAWTRQMNFLSDLDVCLWQSSTVDLNKPIPDGTGTQPIPQSEAKTDEDEIIGVFCVSSDPEQKPHSLYIDNNNLVGTLPTENGKLVSLIELSIKKNSIKGSFPTGLCSLSNLATLDLGYNHLTGSIPTCIGELSSSLSELYMGDNMLVGELPTEMARLSLLKVLVMDENRCSGDFKNVVNSLSALDVLIMNDNNFTTVVDSLFLSNNINLNWTDFSNNLMTLSGDGTFPIHLLSMPQLQLLDLSHNELNGVLPTVIPGNSVLQYLALGRNQLNGNLPSSLTSLSNLVYFDVSSNGFGGQMDVVGKLTKLKTLFMSDNPFDAGQVPSVFTSLTMLTELSLRNTTLKGPLPDFIQSFTNLRLLDLGSNTLSGSVPPGYGDLSSLQYMLLNDNNGINGTLSPKFGIVQTLSGIFVDGTSLSGSVDFLCTLPNIQSNGPEDILFVDRGITCTCAACQFCTASQKSGCSRPQLDSLDLAWDDSFKRDSYKFVNGNKKY